MRRYLHSKLKDFISESDCERKERLGSRLKDIMDVSPVLFRNVNEQRVKPMIMSAIDRYAHNPDIGNRLRLQHALENMGLSSQ